MRYLPFILTILSSHLCFGQNEASSFISFNLTLPPSTLLSMNKISKIEAIDYFTNGISEISETWYINTNGLIIKHELNNTENEDTLPDFTIYDYSKNLLIKETHVAIWNSKNTIDTIITVFTYDKTDKFISSKTTGTCSNEKNRYYSTNRIYDVTIDTLPNHKILYDTIFYNASENPILKSNSYGFPFTKWEYNENNQLIEKVIFSSTDQNSIGRKYILRYKNGKLISEEVYFTLFNNVTKDEYKYFYDNRGFIIRVEKKKNNRFVIDRTYNYY